MTRYRIYTEHKNIGRIRAILDTNLDGYTLFTGVGYWQGQKETSLVVEYLAEEQTVPRVRTCKPLSGDALIVQICKDIKAANEQQAVLWTKETVGANFV